MVDHIAFWTGELQGYKGPCQDRIFRRCTDFCRIEGHLEGLWNHLLQGSDIQLDAFHFQPSVFLSEPQDAIQDTFHQTEFMHGSYPTEELLPLYFAAGLSSGPHGDF